MTWPKFAKTKQLNGCNLLKCLDDFPNSILVTGCQRSGTTMVSRVITKSEGMTNYWFGEDDELDAAQILSGYIHHKPKGRYCFQTTYLNECYTEYFRHKIGHKIIWVLRNPQSVIFSLLYNWQRFGFNELFRTCGLRVLDGKNLLRYDSFGRNALSRLDRACLSYNGKVSQLFELVEGLEPQQIIVVDYDDLIINKLKTIPNLYKFIGLSYKPDYVDYIHERSIDKSRQLSRHEIETIEAVCKPVYLNARKLLSQS